MLINALMAESGFSFHKTSPSMPSPDTSGASLLVHLFPMETFPFGLFPWFQLYVLTLTIFVALSCLGTYSYAQILFEFWGSTSKSWVSAWWLWEGVVGNGVKLLFVLKTPTCNVLLQKLNFSNRPISRDLSLVPSVFFREQQPTFLLNVFLPVGNISNTIISISMCTKVRSV